MPWIINIMDNRLFKYLTACSIKYLVAFMCIFRRTVSTFIGIITIIMMMNL